ncbi:MAG: DUF6515 family protein [Polaribacter sp.]|nr:DUF6515 family protein [Polaribacter sp.]|tara:strand:+ start:90 stop:665 length:576 start_codon:yes stop_codon:yes gene_type:complete
MKSLIRVYGIAALLLVSYTSETAAQTRRTTNDKVVVKKTVSKRIPSTNVTYKKQQRKVVAVRNLPNRTVVRNNGQDYYYANNRFYTQSRGSYIAIAPKIGFRINVLPTNYRRIQFNNHHYYNANGIFYVQLHNEYEVVDPEIGTIVYELPEDYEKVILNDQTYYEYANILYEKIQVNGTRAYEVVGIIEMK